MTIKDIHWREAWEIVRACRLIQLRSVIFLIVYYVITVLNAILDGIGIALLINVVTGTAMSVQSELDPITAFTLSILTRLGISIDYTSLIFLVAGLFFLRSILYFCLLVMDGRISPIIRQKIQDGGFKKLIGGDWEFLRNIRVGQFVGSLTEEATVTAKYLWSVIRSVYFLITSLVLLSIALTISYKLTIVLIAVGIPLFFILQWIFLIQSRLSFQQAAGRQGFTADISERLSGLFQIKVEGQNQRHIRDGLKNQAKVTRLEILIGNYQAYIGSFGVLMPAVGLVAFYLWTLWVGKSPNGLIHLFAEIGVVGVRAVTQLNGFIACLGNISRLSGSIRPVYLLFTIPQERDKKLIDEALKNIKLNDVSYSYNGTCAIQGINFTLEKGTPLVIRGPSGSGKTTIANLVSGIYHPSKGSVSYLGKSGTRYNAVEFKPRVGYVTQDIQLFHGTVRENLVSPESNFSDDTLWGYLEEVGAAGFVRDMGGLDARIAEAGRSLSGGEKRRLGIARALALRPDFIIFDEITSGLDEENRMLVHKTIRNVSKDILVIIITHEEKVEGLGTVLNLS